MCEIDKYLPRVEKLSVDLNCQYRMHPEIWALSNQLFYGKKVHSDFTELTEMNEFICKNKPLLFVNVDGKEERVGNSFQNPNESAAIIGLLRWMNENQKFHLGRFAIIGTYRA